MKISCPKYGISFSFVRSLNAIKSSSVLAPAAGAHSPRYLFRSALNSYRSTANSESSNRSEERRVGKSVDLGGRRIIKKKKKKKRRVRKSEHITRERKD